MRGLQHCPWHSGRRGTNGWITAAVQEHICIEPTHWRPWDHVLGFSGDLLISIVDDDDGARTNLRELMQSLDCNTACFASAVEFLNSDQFSHTACLIGDLQMPGMDGLELQRLLRLQASRLPIIFVTAVGNEKVRRAAVTNGASDFFTKPLDQAQLTNALERALAVVATINVAA
jgi:FixJ family two-component response regulator